MSARLNCDVTVANVGHVARGVQLVEARRTFLEWVDAVKSGVTRGEAPVVLWKDGRPYREFGKPGTRATLAAWAKTHPQQVAAVFEDLAARLLLDEEGEYSPDQEVDVGDFVEWATACFRDCGLIGHLEKLHNE